MKKEYGYLQIYTDLIKYLSDGAKSLQEITEHICKSAELTPTESEDNSASGCFCKIKANIGALINQLQRKQVIGKTADGAYYAKIEAPIALREQKCEAEILKLLSKSPLSKEKIREKLTTLFGTEKTKSRRDDNMLIGFITSTLKSLCEEKIISDRKSVV